MTFDEFKADFRTFLENSVVNLGRKTAKTRQIFIDTVMAKFDNYAFATKQAFIDNLQEENIVDVSEVKPDSMGDRVLCIKPKDRNKALDVGKGVHAMTPTESARADEQLGRSPYMDKTEKKE